MTEIPTTSGADGRTSVGVDDERRQEPPTNPEWRLLLVLGIISILFGLAVVIWPDASLRVVAVLVGIWLLGAGIARVLSAFVVGQGIGRQILSGIVGLLLIIGGVACLRDLAKGLAVLAFIVALTWIFSGLSGIVLAFGATGAQRVGLILVGVASILLGVVFLVVPELSLTALVWLAGLSAIAIGIGEALVAFQLRKEPIALV
jgi:uncharacterized membrane protein HdeD (DUF308 family)